jgi:soluble lytic murein transglycosylase-like protein
MADLGMAELDKLFCMWGKKYRIKKLLLKAVAMSESSMNQKAYRYEPAFWDRYLKDDPDWNTKDRAIVSSSWGLMQIMWTTAWSLGFRGTTGEELEDPATNIMLAAKLLRAHLDRVEAKGLCSTNSLWPIEIALALYNGGARGNPDENGKLRNQKYVDKVFREYCALRAKETECDEG